MNERTTVSGENSTGRMCRVRTVGSRTGLSRNGEIESVALKGRGARTEFGGGGPRRERRRRGYQGERGFFKLYQLRIAADKNLKFKN